MQPVYIYIYIYYIYVYACGHLCDRSERCFNELWIPAVDPEDTTSEIEVIAMNEVNQWLRGLYSMQNLT